MTSNTELVLQSIISFGYGGDPAIELDVLFKNGEDRDLVPISVQAAVRLEAGAYTLSLGDVHLILAGGEERKLGVRPVKPGTQHAFRGSLKLGARALAWAETSETKDDVRFSVDLFGTVLARHDRNWVPEATTSRSLAHVIPRSTWEKWRAQWGRDTEHLILTGPVAKRLRDHREETGHSDDNDVALDLLVASMRSGAAPRKSEFKLEAVCTTRGETTLKNRVIDLVGAAKSRLWISSPWPDGSAKAAILAAVDSGADVRLLVRPGGRGGVPKSVRDSLAYMKEKGASVRMHDMIHARFVLADGILVNSSADLNTHSMDSNREFGLITNEVGVVMKAEKFFDEVWNESSEWEAK